MNKKPTLLKRWGLGAALGLSLFGGSALASSHREAPLIAQDPQADNTDVYAFRSPDDTNTVTIIANYIPFQLPEGGPNYYTFSPNVRYEIHIKNNTATTTDDITYRFTFSLVNEDTATFFNIRLGKRNQRVTYTVQKIVSGSSGTITTTIVAVGQVPPYNIGPRSINGAAGLNLTTPYDAIMRSSVATGTNMEQVYAGPADDPFFVDLAGAFDLGAFRPSGTIPNATNPAKDGLARYNVSTIAIKVPISQLQKGGLTTASAVSILDDNFVIGVWASASRQQISTLNSAGMPTPGGPYVQVSRLGMPLTNEVIIPIGQKDKWNALGALDAANSQFLPFFKNPELAIYMDNRLYGGSVPALNALRIQRASRNDIQPGGFDFGNNQKGLWPLKGSLLLSGTALDPMKFGGLLLPDSVSPRAVDILPIFLTGVPNLAPYQLATGKTNVPNTTALNPLAPGKPFINNFLPAIGDMLRLNMAVPVTPRTLSGGVPNPAFSSLGIIAAAVSGLTDLTYNANQNLQFIPNMDGFPNGRRLEDDVTTIELQAVGGVALAAIGLFYDDYAGAPQSPVTKGLLNTLTFNAGPTKNDTAFMASFPYVAPAWRGFDYTKQARF